MHATRTRAYAVPCTRTLLGIKQAREWQGNKSCKNVLTFSLRRGTAGNRTWQRRLERMTEGDLARCHRDNTKIRHFGSVRVTSCKFKLGVGPRWLPATTSLRALADLYIYECDIPSESKHVSLISIIKVISPGFVMDEIQACQLRLNRVRTRLFPKGLVN